MNTRLALEECVKSDVSDRVAVRLLADCIAEEPGVTYWQACRVAGAIRRAEKNASEVAEAVAIIRYCYGRDGKLDSQFRHFLKFHDMVALDVCVHPGSLPPAHLGDSYLGGSRYIASHNIEVGARWVIARFWNLKPVHINRPDVVRFLPARVQTFVRSALNSRVLESTRIIPTGETK